MAVDKNEIIEKLKRSRGISDESQDILLMDIVEDTISHYLAIGSRFKKERVLEVPDSHSFIISDVSSRRYVRRGSEGLESETVDGYRAYYADPEKDFDAYIDFLGDEYQEGNASEGRVTFY